ncbi:E3 ubiquitin-protein ligase NHLRC1 [Bombina bombina]|uniref:E3 ubiquitin-protein ligase NHLRC1 n=1 Tax=Bombina bombina TaxID=8345 RepID=UPI00235AA057|nr:E3 ubiquitin-protein ligase NHLRC1 [Bombina bombina]
MQQAMSSPATKEIRTMKDFLEEAEINLLECKVCFEKYSQQDKHRPRNLPCGHIMCQECVSSVYIPRDQRLECPFCRQVYRSMKTSVCLPVLHLMEVLGRVAPDYLESDTPDRTSYEKSSLRSTSFNQRWSFGGWGTLINPTGLAMCKKTRCLVVAHDGKKRVSVFTMNGKCIQQMGDKTDMTNGIIYPIDVAVTLDGYIAVTDTGDHSLKVFNQYGKRVVVVQEPFCLPWGIGINPQNEAIVSDTDAGELVLVAADFQCGKIQKTVTIYSNLCNPKEIAVCQKSGTVVIVEHVAKSRQNSTGTCIKILSSKMMLVRQIDSFSLSLVLPLAVHARGVTFDEEGNILVADANNRCVICLDQAGDGNPLKNIVASGLSYPVAVTTLGDGSIAVLDALNHSVLVYTPQ